MQGLPNDVKAIIYKMSYDDLVKKISINDFKLNIVDGSQVCLRVRLDSVYDNTSKMRYWSYMTQRNRFVEAKQAMWVQVLHIVL